MAEGFLDAAGVHSDGAARDGKTREEQARDRVVLAGLSSPALKAEERSDEQSMEELSALTETAGGTVEGIILQNRPAPDPRTFIGEGKAEEIRDYCKNAGATMVIFDNDLSPSQMKNLTDLLGVQVLDRCGLILDIFARRAKTKEGRLQVELAQYQYLLPRLTGMWTHPGAARSVPKAPAKRSWRRTAAISAGKSTS